MATKSVLAAFLAISVMMAYGPNSLCLAAGPDPTGVAGAAAGAAEAAAGDAAGGGDGTAPPAAAATITINSLVLYLTTIILPLIMYHK